MWGASTIQVIFYKLEESGGVVYIEKAVVIRQDLATEVSSRGVLVPPCSYIEKDGNIPTLLTSQKNLTMFLRYIDALKICPGCKCELFPGISSSKAAMKRQGVWRNKKCMVLSDPDLLTPEEVDRLVRVVFWKAIHDDDSAEPAARFCARVITPFCAIPASLSLRSPELDHHTKVECLRRALTTAGEAAERGAPARMVALVACLRDAFLSPDVPEDDRLTLLELIEMRASRWKLSREQQLSYASVGDAVGDECDDVQNLSPLPWRVAE
ncbi:hypothetical protein MRX96_055513 [Rhipicephalus microplus]